MKITLNGKLREIADAWSLEQLLEANSFGNKRVAVEINRQIISRSLHGEHMINVGDHVEIVHVIGGG